MEISCQSKDINIIAKTIEGADLIEDDPEVSSCFQATDLSMWFAYNGGFIGVTGADFPTTSVPTIVYKKPQTVYMVTSERAERGEPQNCIDDVQIFSDLKAAEIYADMRFRIVLNNFHTSKEKVRLFEEEKYLEKYGNGSLHANFIASSGEWDVWVTIEKKEIQ